MNDIMLDIETFGTSPGCAILSIGAVRFNLEGEVPSKYESEIFYAPIQIKSNLTYGLTMDPNTILWWMTQSDESRKKLIKAEEFGYRLDTTLDLFSRWIKHSSVLSVWGNSNRFDCGILAYAFEKLGMEVPWNTKLERDMRTYIMEYPEVYKSSANRNTIHDPIEDCLYQIDVVQKVYELKKSK